MVWDDVEWADVVVVVGAQAAELADVLVVVVVVVGIAALVVPPSIALEDLEEDCCHFRNKMKPSMLHQVEPQMFVEVKCCL